MSTHIITIEHKIGEDNWEEWEYELEYDASPYDPGVCSGPVERCYPPEGGVAEVTGDVRKRPIAKKGENERPWQPTSYDQLLRAYVIWRDIEPKKHKTAEDVADEAICESLYEAAEQEAEDARDDYDEDLADRMRYGDDY